MLLFQIQNSLFDLKNSSGIKMGEMIMEFIPDLFGTISIDEA